MASAIGEATGIGWDDWQHWLDARRARDLDHGGIAALAAQRMSEDADQVENAPWWAQSVAVAYEQSIGRRVQGQRADGTFYVSVSRTLSCTRQDAMAAWENHVEGLTELAGRQQSGPPRSSSTPKRDYWRTSFTDGSRLQMAVEPRGDRSQLTLTHEGLPSPEARESARQSCKSLLQQL